MRVIKSINNNIAICLDSQGKEVVAFGKGVGFRKPPYEIDLRQIEKTYYNIDAELIHMLHDIPPEIFEISADIVNKISMTLSNPVDANIVVTLADHIAFCVQRYRKNMTLKMPIIYDIQHMYEAEMGIGMYGLKLIEKRMKIRLPREEAAYMAIHIVNAEAQYKNKRTLNDEEMIEHVTEMIETDFQIKIDRNNFNYSRFVSHMHYLFKRGKENHLIHTENEKVFQDICREFPMTYGCSKKVCQYVEKKLKVKLTDEEIMYLMLHINRLCTREDCYQ